MKKTISSPWLLAAFLATLSAATPSIAKMRVVLDAGHGGSDTGVKAGSESEKNWNLKVSQALEKAFTSAGYDVLVIRGRDESIPAAKRADLINASGAAAVIVIHADREWTGTQRGPFLVVEPPTRPEAGDVPEIQRWGAVPPNLYRSSLRLARSIAQALGVNTVLSSLSDTRGTPGETLSADGKIYCLPHQSLRYLSRPAVVLTPLFLSSSSDLKKFSQSDNLAGFASQVVEGTTAYLQGTP
jgi:N-acetylmuramoyl-L-alanine amidase